MISVGVNLLWLRPGIVGGSESYATALLDGITRLAPPDVELTGFALPNFWHAHSDLGERLNTTTAPVSGHWRTARVAAESTWLYRQSSMLDLVHHMGGTTPSRRSVPAVVSILDTQYLEFPESFGVAKRAFLRRRVPAAIRAASIIMAMSDYGRSVLIDRLGADPDRVAVVPHGVDPVLPAIGEAATLRPLFVYPAITYPHKNHSVLLDALARMDDAMLVLTGGPGRADHALRRQAEELGIADRVRRVGWVSRSTLSRLYRQATALVFPSRYEGFGIPVLEAMAHGCPVIAADATALPDVVGKAGVLLPPDDPDAWAAAMEQVLCDEDFAARLVAAGHDRVKEFSVEAAAGRLLDVYRRA